MPSDAVGCRFATGVVVRDGDGCRCLDTVELRKTMHEVREKEQL